MADQDISGDGGVMKKLLQEGSGKQPAQGDTVFVHYTGKLTNGNVFDSSVGKPHRAKYGFYFTLGAGDVIKGWDVGVATMKIGEKALLTCSPEYAYGAQGAPPVIPANATLLFEVELLDTKPLTSAERRAIDAEVAALR
mmetsp:Transcript_73220/g.160228  ORF Transcript_73220/g.160228 Transcript_73220/m.160228 type:complete len:139 (-) Transcript_73220:103-519(-)|eukprot:CAMPEP_0206458164 /NCGR_PEP_ID=MMETSP0324_2-20121206/23397_1 /ASSEMBLY_ACC=CAM_ASM_000836 /TAXON_ID=2866 /ORGANISM="Crypthecodinium cohnii, Strain Seligo" /LENGTH=138 /DNA_ID=CAMNT_0053929431 /DNA_START=86 /DNA_END=502 /DNA_ORIENTATION=+